MNSGRAFYALVALACISISSARATPLQDAQAAYNRGDYVSALQIWKPLADQGNTFAQKSVGWMYQNGRGMPASQPDAVWWYTKAAEGGNKFAQFELGLAFATGAGVEKDFTAAMKWLRPLADGNEGNSVSQFAVASMLLRGGDGVNPDFATGAKYLQLIVQLTDMNGRPGPRPSEIRYLSSAEAASGIELQDSSLFNDWYSQQLEVANTSAIKTLGMMYGRGQGVPQDFSKAAFILRKIHHDAETLFRVAQIYDNGLHDNVNAFAFYDLAAQDGSWSGHLQAADRRNQIGLTLTPVQRQQADMSRDTLRSGYAP